MTQNLETALARSSQDACAPSPAGESVFPLAGNDPAGSPVSIADVQKHVREHFGISQVDLLSGRKDPSLSMPRHVAYWLSVKLTSASYPVIGRHFKKHHSSILSGARKIDRLISAKNDPWGKAAVDLKHSIEKGISA